MEWWNDGIFHPYLVPSKVVWLIAGSLRTWSAPKCWSVLRRLRGSILRGWNHDWDHGMGMFNRRWKYNPWKNLGFSPSSRIQPKLVWVEPLVKGYVATSGITRDMQTLVLYWLFRPKREPRSTKHLTFGSLFDMAGSKVPIFHMTIFGIPLPCLILTEGASRSCGYFPYGSHG